MPRTRFVFHCESCSRMVEESLRYSAECPPETSGKVDGFPSVNWASLAGTEYGERKTGETPYFDESLNTFIYSKKHKEEELAKRGLQQTDSGARKKTKKKVQYFV